MESGLLGLVIYIMFLVYMLYSNYDLHKKLGKENPFSKINLGVCVAFIGLFISGLAGGFITSPIISLVLVFLVMIVAKMKYESQRV